MSLTTMLSAVAHWCNWYHKWLTHGMIRDSNHRPGRCPEIPEFLKVVVKFTRVSWNLCRCPEIVEHTCDDDGL